MDTKQYSLVWQPRYVLWRALTALCLLALPFLAPAPSFGHAVSTEFPPAYAWHTFYGSSDSEGGDYGNDIAIAEDGSVYIVGHSSASWLGDSDTEPIHAYTGSSDIVVLKLDSSGSYLWHTFYGSSGGDGGASIALDIDGNVYIVGGSDASWLGDGDAEPIHAYTGSSDIVVLKLDSSGAYQWHTFYGSNDSDYGRSIAVAEGGTMYILGDSWLTWQGDNDAPPLHAYSGLTDFVVVKLNNSGSYLWHTFYGSTEEIDEGGGIAVAGGGGATIVGRSYASWLGDGGAAPLHAHSGNGYEDMAVLRLNNNGAYQWHTFYGSSQSDSGNGIAEGGDGSVYVVGSSNASWQGDSGAAPLHAYSGYQALVVVKLGSSGNYLWHTFYGSNGSWIRGWDVNIMSIGAVHIAGTSEGSWLGDGGAAPLHAYSGDGDITVVRLDSSGAYYWHTFYGSDLADSGSGGHSVDGGGDVYVAGTSDGTWLGDGGKAPRHAHSGYPEIAALKLESQVKLFLPLVLR